jgi:hypothetical protein
MSLPRLILDIGFSGPSVGNVFVIGDPIRGAVNFAEIAGDVWTEISLERVKSWSVRAGAGSGDQPTQRYEAATATIVLHDPEREFDSENLDGPYVSAGESQVRAMVRVRLRAVWDDVSYGLFYGHADDWVPEYQGNDWTYVTLTATDPSKIFAADDRGTSVATGAGDDSGARVGRILDAANWPTEDRSIAVGDTTLQATELAGNALAELQLVQDTELGEFFFDSQGWAVFRNRQAMPGHVRRRRVRRHQRAAVRRREALLAGRRGRQPDHCGPLGRVGAARRGRRVGGPVPREDPHPQRPAAPDRRGHPVMGERAALPVRRAPVPVRPARVQHACGGPRGRALAAGPGPAVRRPDHGQAPT